jgi:antirestriction protein ArdC
VSHEHAEEILANRPVPAAPITHDGGSRAYYRPTTHTIHMPERTQFLGPDHYYATLFHEVTHSTGITLGRFEAAKFDPFGSDPYAFEELVAEMGATALMSECGMDSEIVTENSAAYLAGWVRRFREQRDMLVTAAGKAQKAVTYLLNAPERVSDEAEEEVAA